MSETSPPPLRSIPRPLDHASSDPIGSFRELQELLKDHADFSAYQINLSNEHAFNLQRDDVNKIFVSASIFLDTNAFAPFVDEANKKASCVICVGAAEELKKMPWQGHSHIHQVSLPLSIANAIALLESLHKLQRTLNIANQERFTVAQASEEVKYVLSISRELNGERNIPKLLNLILQKARDVTRADAGSIYTLEYQGQNDIRKGHLHFRFTQNDSIVQNLYEFQIPINEGSIVGNAVLRAQTINIPDLYKLSADPKENPLGISHDRSWDKKTGYESHSMLTIPLYDISHAVIGVIQLINAKNVPKKQLKTPEEFRDVVVPFAPQLVEYAEIVAQQAGIALENAKMQDDIQKLFDGFVNASVTAIELRDPTTSGHSHRVAKMTTQLAHAMNKSHSGPYKDTRFNEDQLREIEYASLLHDFGKLGVREHVLLKAKKLYPSEFRLIEERFRLIRAGYENECLRKSLDFLEHPENYPPGLSVEHFRLEKEKQLEQLAQYFEFICKANEPTVLEQHGFELLRDIANCSFDDTIEKARPFLLPEELKALSVSRGSLTAEEFAEIQSHVEHTYEFLRKIPWGRKLANVPQIAAKHHEKLDGSGYPTSSEAEDIPVQSRMMTIADIYDALTAADRPYKKAVPWQQALDIIEREVKGGKVDKFIYDIFVDAKIYKVVFE